MEIIQTPRCVKNFESTLGIAFELAQEYSRAHFSLLLGKSQQLCDIAIFDRSFDSSLSALEYAVAKARNSDNIEKALIISVINSNPDVLFQSDIEMFLWGEETLYAVGVELLDWVKVYDDLYRSFARTVAPNRAW